MRMVEQSFSIRFLSVQLNPLTWVLIGPTTADPCSYWGSCVSYPFAPGLAKTFISFLHLVLPSPPPPQLKLANVENTHEGRGYPTLGKKLKYEKKMLKSVCGYRERGGGGGGAGKLILETFRRSPAGARGMRPILYSISQYRILFYFFLKGTVSLEL